jgi:hypothetical protein
MCQSIIYGVYDILVCLHAPQTVYDMVQQFSLRGHPSWCPSKVLKCSISRMGGPFLSQIWDPLLLWYVPMPPKLFVTWCSGSHSVATPPDNPQKCEMLYLKIGWSVSLTNLGSTLSMVCPHAP